MAARPSGTVTFLFTDIEGSTARWEHAPAEIAVAFQRHETLLRQAIADHGGYAYKLIAQAPLTTAYYAYDGYVGAARSAWRRSITLARQIVMPYEKSLAHYELGRHLLATYRWRRHHLAHAVALFARLGADDDLRRAIAVVRHDGSGADQAPG
jgi:class 3 adenylate cyclase